MSTVLLTGFEPFAGDTVNPSGDAVRLLAERWEGPHELVADVLPVAFAGAATRLRALIEQHRPDVVVATGLAGGRSAVGVERIAVNLADARIPDNDGAQPIDEPCIAGAPAAAFATLPVKAIVRAMTAAGISAELSHTAGTFVCNHVFFAALDAAPPRTTAGFIHVPWAEGSAPAGQPALPIDDIVAALGVAIATAIDPPPASAYRGGTLH
jgi:pyroglutamyl-peptidase